MSVSTTVCCRALATALAVAACAGCDAVIGDAAPPGGLDCPAPETFFRDADGDQFGDPAVAMDACEPPDGFVRDATDCDDADDARNPDAVEVCDDIDNDCSGADRCAVDLIAQWAFDDAGAAVVDDVSGNGNVGALRGGAALADGSLQCTGNDDFVEIAHSDAFLLDEGALVLWFRAGDVALGAPQGLWSKDSSGVDTGGHLTAALLADGRVDVRLQDAGADGDFRTTTDAPVTSDDWHHLAFTFGPQGMVLRVDGRPAATNPYPGGTGPTSGGAGNFEPIAIGARTVNSGDLVVDPISNPLVGEVGDARVYRRALTEQELDELFAFTTP